MVKSRILLKVFKHNPSGREGTRPRKNTEGIITGVRPEQATANKINWRRRLKNMIHECELHLPYDSVRLLALVNVVLNHRLPLKLDHFSDEVRDTFSEKKKNASRR
jgi:hypothetical protein